MKGIATDFFSVPSCHMSACKTGDFLCKTGNFRLAFGGFLAYKKQADAR